MIQPFSQLDEATEAALRASIQRFGVVVPIVVDGKGRILDGHHRARIARELGVSCPQVSRSVKNDDDATALAFSLNADRRMLTAEVRQQIVADLRSQGHSLRAIAGVTRASLGTVHADAKRAGVQPEHVLGEDGKEYAPTRPTVPNGTVPPEGVDANGEIVSGDASTREGEGVDVDEVVLANTADDSDDGVANSPDAPLPVDPVLGYRASFSRERSRVRSGLLIFDPARCVETSDDHKAIADFAADLHTFADALEQALAGPRLKVAK